MHNGGIAEFPRMKRRLQSVLPDEIFNVPSGNTGSYPAPNPNPNPLLMIAIIRFRMGIRTILIEGKPGRSQIS